MHERLNGRLFHTNVREFQHALHGKKPKFSTAISLKLSLAEPAAMW